MKLADLFESATRANKHRVLIFHPAGAVKDHRVIVARVLDGRLRWANAFVGEVRQNIVDDAPDDIMRAVAQLAGYGRIASVVVPLRDHEIFPTIRVELTAYPEPDYDQAIAWLSHRSARTVRVLLPAAAVTGYYYAGGVVRGA